MKSLEIPNLPDDLYDQIERLARVRGQSVGDVAAEFLRKAVAGPDDVEQKLLAEVRAERQTLAARGVYLTDEFLDKAKRWGRE